MIWHAVVPLLWGTAARGADLSDAESANKMLAYNIALMGMGLVLHLTCNLHMDVTAMQKAYIP